MSEQGAVITAAEAAIRSILGPEATYHLHDPEYPFAESTTADGVKMRLVPDNEGTGILIADISHPELVALSNQPEPPDWADLTPLSVDAEQALSQAIARLGVGADSHKVDLGMFYAGRQSNGFTRDHDEAHVARLFLAAGFHYNRSFGEDYVHRANVDERARELARGLE